jgi:ubiquitin carboxyl-terminal hydrolase 8
MNFKHYENKGLTGLENIGNTCYLNSCMQVLSHTYELNTFLENKLFNINDIPDSIIFLEWNKLRELMWSENCIVAPHGFVDAIKKISIIKKREIFSGYEQNDVSEFLLFILECFHNALSRSVDVEIIGESKNKTDDIALKIYNMMSNLYKKEYSEISDIFFGISITELKSLETNDIIGCNPEIFSILSLCIPENKTNISIFDCFDEYCKIEILDKDNIILNEKTGNKEIIEKTTGFWSLPNILIIDIKRYNMQGKKLNHLISSDLDNVDFSKYILGYNKYSYIYELYGVCNHSGNTHGGHYTSIIKNANNKWYEFNDTNITEIRENKIISNKSYCFFYRKKK